MELTSSSREATSPEATSELVRKIQAGDPAAESELISRYGRGVTILIRRASSDTSAVDDLFQQTFQIALEKIRGGDVREPERLSGFICSLARNLVIDHFRRVAAHRFTSLVEGTQAADPSPGPLEDLLKVERASIVRSVLSELPSERDREILFRFYIAEDEKDSICRDLVLTSLHFNRVLFRARERYRELYEETTRRKVGKPR
jgi:RNA polymerase sigma-70 factor (ECF subfamily)